MTTTPRSELYAGETTPTANNPVLRGVDLAIDRLVLRDCFTERTLRVLDELREEIILRDVEYPSEDWEYGWKYGQPLTQSEWRTVYPYKVHPSMVQVRRRIVPQSDWEVVPASPAPVSSEYAAGPQGDAIRASKATTGSTAVPALPTESAEEEA